MHRTPSLILSVLIGIVVFLSLNIFILSTPQNTYAQWYNPADWYRSLFGIQADIKNTKGTGLQCDICTRNSDCSPGLKCETINYYNPYGCSLPFNQSGQRCIPDTTPTSPPTDVKPTVSLASSNTTVELNKDLTFTATITDSDDANKAGKLIFEKDQVAEKTDTSSQHSYIYTYSPNSAEIGTHTFRARAYDIHDTSSPGNYSNTITVTVTNVNKKPVITSFSINPERFPWDNPIPLL